MEAIYHASAFSLKASPRRAVILDGRTFVRAKQVGHATSRMSWTLRIGVRLRIVILDSASTVMVLCISTDFSAGSNHLQEAVLDAVEGVGANSAESQALVERSDGKHPAIAGELPRRWLDHQRRSEEG
jgi:hypothetical protein